MDVLFLDANVLFSAAYRSEAGVARLWRLQDIQLVTSDYALEEARRNLEGSERRERLEHLIAPVRRIPEPPDRPLPDGIVLPAKDRPILLGAVAARATHLLTGDVTHFGRYFGGRVEGIRILAPAAYLAARES